MLQSIDPWNVTGVTDYNKLIEYFGISPFDEEVLNEIPNPHRLMRRGVIFGHRDFKQISYSLKHKKPFVVLDGFMPTGKAHLGHKMVMDQIVWYQSTGAIAIVGIADREAYEARGLSWKECRRIGIDEYLTSLIALGLKPEKTCLYFQSECQPVKDLAFELGTKVNFSELSAIYGFENSTRLAHMMSTVTQSADILHFQLSEDGPLKLDSDLELIGGGPIPVVVPVGADQDPHIRLTRDLASRMNLFSIDLIPQNEKSSFSYWRISQKQGSTEPIEDLFKEIKKISKKIALESSNDFIIVKNISPEKLIQVMQSNHIDFDFSKACVCEEGGWKIMRPYLFPNNSSVLAGLAEDFIQKGYSVSLNIAQEFKEHITVPESNISKEELSKVVQEIEFKYGGYAFIQPSSTYHKFMSGLTGGKMSSSIPGSNIALTENPEEAKKKVMKAKTGGRETAEEQRRIGGDPCNCSVYELYVFHLIENDCELEEIKTKCVNGQMLCGECKKIAGEKLESFLKDHQEKRELAKGKLNEFLMNYKKQKV
ncbi:tryptophan--tRNA ligase [Methanolapillus millepedarum]|uniref:Tryptophan--tRNA ligase n=1 Tax=Methanolapillus millepedarum TaxID=3028296 RepID=A0AA96V608_9EURY|nr:hypothetical protein MsAc7_13030 [Methanosarcinaceae archaeon Ac7]